MPTPIAVEIELTDEDRDRLEAWSRRPKTAQALALRSRIVLGAAEGLSNGEIAERERVSRPTVTKWRNRFAERRLEGLLDEPRPGRPRTVTDAQVESIVTTTLESTPKDATHWSTRSLAAHLGVSQDAVWRTWRSVCSPTARRSLKLSTDPQFVEKIYDICGLYLNPPERAVVLCVDDSVATDLRSWPAASRASSKGPAGPTTGADPVGASGGARRTPDHPSTLLSSGMSIDGELD